MHNSKVGTTECPAHAEQKMLSGTFMTTMVMRHNKHHEVFKAHLGSDRHDQGSGMTCGRSVKCQRRAHGLLGTKRLYFFMSSLSYINSGFLPFL